MAIVVNVFMSAFQSTRIKLKKVDERDTERERERDQQFSVPYNSQYQEKGSIINHPQIIQKYERPLLSDWPGKVVSVINST